MYLWASNMRRFLLILFFISLISLSGYTADAQCSICAKSVQQMGDKPAKGFNSGIIYLMLAPFGIIGFVGYRWWKSREE